MVFAIVVAKKGRSREGSRIAPKLPHYFLALRPGVRAGGRGGFAKTAIRYDWLRLALGVTPLRAVTPLGIKRVPFQQSTAIESHKLGMNKNSGG